MARQLGAGFRAAFHTYWSWAAMAMAGFTLINQVIAIGHIRPTLWLEKVLVLYHAFIAKIGALFYLATHIALSGFEVQLLTVYCLFAAPSARALSVFVKRRDNGLPGVSGSRYGWASRLLTLAESGFGSDTKLWRHLSIALIAGLLWPLMVIGNVGLIQADPARRGAGGTGMVETSYRTVFLYQLGAAIIAAVMLLAVNAYAETRDDAVKETDCSSYTVIAAGQLNVRAAPFGKAAIVRKLPTGAVVRGDAPDGDWVKIWDPVTGYVSRQFVHGRCDETPASPSGSVG